MPSKRKKNKRRMRRVDAPIPEAPVLAPAEFEVKESAAITTEITQMYDQQSLSAEVEAEIVSVVQVEVEKEPDPEPTVEAEAAPVIKADVQPEEAVAKAESGPVVEAECIPIKPEPEVVVKADASPAVKAEVQPEEAVVKAEPSSVVETQPILVMAESVPVVKAECCPLEAEVQPEEGLVKAEPSSVVETQPIPVMAESVPVVKAEAAPVVKAEVQPEEAVVKAESSLAVKTEALAVKPQQEPVVKAEANLVAEAEVEPEEVVIKAEVEPVKTVAAEEVQVVIKNILETLEPVEAIFKDAPVAKVATAKPVVEAAADPVADTGAGDFVVVEPAPIVKAALTTPAAEEQVLAAPRDESKAPSESRSNVASAPETTLVTADEVIDTKEEIEAAVEIEVEKDEKKASDVLPGDLSSPQPIISELQCHAQLATVPAPMEIPAQVPQNGHMAAEVTMEG
ncbi:magnetosome-associated protein MamJ isoform X4 [Esox lucius]|uniref:magnetosome-associated protein MamJ isoform X4 n=1 Tax=Esox lucius TaxID=8010 RepID=UPI0014771C54|nr:magnetosome-associated protein MamJ isoform X4 [Esox lucius]